MRHVLTSLASRFRRPRARSTGALLAALLLASGAFAQLRTIPDEAKRGSIRHVREMLVAIDGNEMLLSPSATIRDRLNLIIVPSALPAFDVEADYIVDANGQVLRVWLITPEEAARPRQRSFPLFR